MRDAAFDALPPSLTRRISSARATSPSASFSAFLHSIIGASVLTRSSPTIAAVIAAMSFLLKSEQAVDRDVLHIVNLSRNCLQKGALDLRLGAPLLLSGRKPAGN